jgi:hypothetical protein
MLMQPKRSRSGADASRILPDARPGIKVLEQYSDEDAFFYKPSAGGEGARDVGQGTTGLASLIRLAVESRDVDVEDQPEAASPFRTPRAIKSRRHSQAYETQS